ncbi:hypothetical protein [Streptomyces nigrescens]|uniref:hypothetical protein n=1 Tax=Streptomyces nigrescens TaxID=1920 RepID=UPI003701ABE4
MPGILAALEGLELGAFYLAAAATAARRPGVFPAGLAQAATAALNLRRALPGPAAGARPATAVLFADQALFDLLTHLWRTGAGLPGDLPEILAHLRGLAGRLRAMRRRWVVLGVHIGSCLLVGRCVGGAVRQPGGRGEMGCVNGVSGLQALRSACRPCRAPSIRR